jgi:hydrogenase-4 component E
MNALLDATLVALLLINLRLLGASRLGASIRVVAAQGLVLGIFTLAVNTGGVSAHTVGLAVLSVGLKAVAFPWLLFRALREAKVRREIEPLVGFILSILGGVLGLGFSVWIGSRLPLPAPTASPLVVPVALFTMFTGLFLIVSRKQALTQVLGYLVLENGIYAFGVALLLQEPMLVELGILLDVFVGVFVMGITIFHLNRAFDSIDTDQLSALRDWTP